MSDLEMDMVRRRPEGSFPDRDMDMITITRAQFQEAVQRCVNDFRDCCPDTVPKNIKDLFVFAVRGWADGLEAVLFDDDDEKEEEEQ